MHNKTIFIVSALLAFCTINIVWADPCGMVPPVYMGKGTPLTRIGVQQTYVFYKDGIETFVIRPGFSGKVDQFGMLIPFPTPPAIRKVSDDIFPQLAAAVDPPEVLIDLTPRPPRAFSAQGLKRKAGRGLRFRDQVKVLREEAVGMYEVAVLEAGSAQALKIWMDQHGYKYPKGMDKPCNDYVKAGWCFVAIKTRVGQKKGVEPKPGMRKVDSKLPAGANFDGFVQAMGFRFHSDEFVVPMRLSAFNEGELRNIVYILTDEPKRIRSISEKFVVRQISGEELYANVTEPLPLRIIGGTINDLSQWYKDNLKKMRNPVPKNGIARELFASDLLAVLKKQLSHPHEEQEKMLLRIGERLGLRGPKIDALNVNILVKERERIVKEALSLLKGMTLTVIDGDFPRDVLANENLKFDKYVMAANLNNPEKYDAKRKGPGVKRQGLFPSSSEKNVFSNKFWLFIGVLFLSFFGWRKLSAKNKQKTVRLACLFGILIGGATLTQAVFADPCGMVPPISLGKGSPLTRIGVQKTYVFYKDGIETFVIRPGFSGKVDNFGMLIPFPSPPAIRKVPDNIFSHLAAAVDPPEIEYGIWDEECEDDGGAVEKEGKLGINSVRVLREEAVGMYEVAVLEAGSAQALKRWMDQHGYQYPKGMDKPCNDYVKSGWCFVAVKTRVGPKKGVEPKPGMRKVDSKMAKGSTFDGFVQAMGFRFYSKEFVVPMRLSAFNEGELRNIVYILTDEPKRIRSISEKFVVRQIPGEVLYRNVTEPLPFRIYGGTIKELSKWDLDQLKNMRNPIPHNGLARELFAADLLAVFKNRLSHPHEEQEKMLLRIGERLGLRGPKIDAINMEALKSDREKIVAEALKMLKGMTLTVVDGDFPREVLANQNLKFDKYLMAANLNNPGKYDAKRQGPGSRRQGLVPQSQSVGISPLLIVFLAAFFGFFCWKKLSNQGRQKAVRLICLFGLLLGVSSATQAVCADPCGMVPPIYMGKGKPLTRIGVQKTYVFYKDGIETFVIRPGFSGKVDQFGMLIPFPTPPAIRKVSDDIFPHLAAAVDPPEVLIDLRPRLYDTMAKSSGPVAENTAEKKLQFDEVKVLNQEAVGMYEVAVLAAGSAQALNRWMDQHGYKYPAGMDKPCNDYVKAGWCFVAVKTRVGQKKGVEPKPGMRKVDSKLPAGANFDGFVQAMGFRFYSKEFVVPMRLSAFNEGELRNIVYILTDEPKRIRSISEKFVVRQISGEELYRNVTEPLPLRIIGGTINDLSQWYKDNLKKMRNPVPKNGLARELFAADLLAVLKKQLAHPHEEQEKMLLRIGERLGLRGPKIDALNVNILVKERERIVKEALSLLKGMTLTVIDGDFPRDVLANENLKFDKYVMATNLNNPEKYDAKNQGPGVKRQGFSSQSNSFSSVVWKGLTYFFGLLLIGTFVFWLNKSKKYALVKALILLVTVVGITSATQVVHADPCGMVPPIYIGKGRPLTRIGVQKTYVFYKDGIETFVIRPGFSGKVDQFGMLIPFPTPPAIRKVSDDIFPHLAAAVDPPEVLIDLRPKPKNSTIYLSAGKKNDKDEEKLSYNEVKVLNQEAVGMYEVAVLAAGSAQALNRWMDQHGYKYPAGMDKPCNDYVKAGWCFVAVKTRVGQKKGVEPKPGMRKVDSKLPAGANFDGFVQAMGFRFRSDEFVVPMRLSAFNEGELRNIVYILTDEPKRIRSISEKFVVRQISGEELYRNVTEPLPLRIIGGTINDLSQWYKDNLKKMRNPVPKNGLARELFAADLLAVLKKQLAHPHEEQEKMLLRIGERLGLRGPKIDALNMNILVKERERIVKEALALLKGMTLTVIDGDFPRDVLANENLKFDKYVMAANLNNPEKYDAKNQGPGIKRQGIGSSKGFFRLVIGEIMKINIWNLFAFLFASLFAGFAALKIRSRRNSGMINLALLFVIALSFSGTVFAEDPSVESLIDQLADSKKANAAVEALLKRGSEAMPHLLGEALEGDNVVRRGWAIVCLVNIDNQEVDKRLEEIHTNGKQPPLIRTWAAAALVQRAKTVDELIKLASLINSFPSLDRPVGKLVVQKLSESGKIESIEGVIQISIQIPTLQAALAPMILNSGRDRLMKALTTSKNQEVRRYAAAYLGTLANQGDKKVASSVANIYAFSPDANQVPWEGGPLFIPGIQWDKENAQRLVGGLVSWFIWAERNNRKDLQNQIHNNIRSLSLARAAGYQSPAWNNIGYDGWMIVWGNLVGKKEIQRMLDEQGVGKDPKFQNVLNRINK